MPNEGQLADSAILRRFEHDPRLGQVLGELERFTPASQSPPVAAPVNPSDWLPEHVIAIDGSLHELPLKDGFPGSQICYYSIVSVLLEIAKMREADKSRPVPPAIFRDLEKAEAMTAVLTGANVVRKGETDAEAAFRRYLFETLEQNGFNIGTESLLQTYEHLLTMRPSSTKVQHCPYGDRCQAPGKAFTQGGGCYTCSCPNVFALYSTDSLDVHNSMSETGANGRMFGEALQVIENLWLVNVIRWCVDNLDTKTLGDLAFVMDGPLRVDGEPAWLSQAIKSEMRRLNDSVVARGGKDLLIVGIEKTGNFVEHFKLLDMQTTGSPDKLDPQTLFLLTNEYIRKRIAPGDRPYGQVTYFGRKFFYKTKTKALICGTVPYLRDGDDDLDRADASQFARIEDILSILDRLASARYPNAIIPVLAAHAECSIPLTQGRVVLEMLTKAKSGVLM